MGNKTNETNGDTFANESRGPDGVWNEGEGLATQIERDPVLAMNPLKAGLVDAGVLADESPVDIDAVINGGFDTGDKVEIIAPSKCRKTFFAIQLAISLAAGRDFLGLTVPHARRVIYVNFEIKRDWMKRRLNSMLAATGTATDALQGRLSFLNLRDMEKITPALFRAHIVELARSVAADVVIIDPRYKLMDDGLDENTPTGLADVLAVWNDLSRAGISPVVVTHDAKGNVGEKSTRDRGAGSNWAGRDCDCRIVLTPHLDAEKLTVVSLMKRNYPPMDDFTIQFLDGAFSLSEVAPRKAVNNRPRAPKPDMDVARQICKTHKDEPLTSTAFKSELRDCVGCGKTAAEDFLALALSNKTLVKTACRKEKDGTWVRDGARMVVSTPDWITAYEKTRPLGAVVSQPEGKDKP